MLVGISGKMGSGKNLVCTIIQGLTAAKKHNIENPSFEWIKKYYINSIWEQKAFAGKLKQIASLLTGVSIEMFEDQEFKNKKLPEEWWYYILPNKIRVNYFDCNNGELIKNSKLIKTTPRLLLQIIGTECIRDKVHPNAWVNALFADYKSNLCDNGIFATMKTENGSTISWIPNPILEPNSYPNWIITDMRFPNELEAVKSRGGISIRVNRDKTNNEVTEKERISYARNQLKSKYGIEISEYPNEVSIKTDEHLYKNGKLNSIYVAEFNELCDSYKRKEFKEHPSETALDDAEFDYTIENNGTIEDLIHTVSLILKREKII